MTCTLLGELGNEVATVVFLLAPGRRGSERGRRRISVVYGAHQTRIFGTVEDVDNARVGPTSTTSVSLPSPPVGSDPRTRRRRQECCVGEPETNPTNETQTKAKQKRRRGKKRKERERSTPTPDAKTGNARRSAAQTVNFLFHARRDGTRRISEYRGAASFLRVTLNLAGNETRSFPEGSGSLERRRAYALH